jgi:quercetin dioxygenase-like cupin family protein
MEEKSNEATAKRPQGDRMLDAKLVNIDLNSLVEQIRTEEQWVTSDRNAITVFKTDGMRIVLIALHKDAEMVRHTANGMISVQVLEGQMLFDTDEQPVELSKGQMLALHKGIPHSVLAKEETIFLLTLTTEPADK